MFKNLFNRQFVVTFVVALIINLLIITFVFSSGVYTGFNGAFGWDAKSFGDTVGSIFGSFTSFVLLIGTLALIGAVLWFTHWLARREKKIWVVLWFVVAAIAVAFVAPSIHIKNFDFAFVFILVLIVVSAIQVGVFKWLLAPRAQSTKTVVKTASTKPVVKSATR